MDFYILKGQEPIKATHDEWLRWVAETAEGDVTLRVARDDIDEEVFVSTVFLSLDHNILGGPPHVFETMIFGGENDGYMRRYSTWEDAVKGHKDAVRPYRIRLAAG